MLTGSARAANLTWIAGSFGLACAIAAALAAAQLAAVRGYGGVPLVATTAALALLLLPFFLLCTTELPRRLATWLEVGRFRVFSVIALPLVPYLVYALGTASLSFVPLLKLVGYVLLPLLLLLSARTSGPPPRMQDALAVLAVWMPLELGWLRDVWPWPNRMGAYTMSEIVGVNVALVLFVSVRGLTRVGVPLALRRIDLRETFWNLLFFLSLGIPIGLATHFIAPGDGISDPLGIPGRFAGIFLVIALPEELLFRGLIQNMLGRFLPATCALFAAAVLFGAAHLNNGSDPDLRYFLLATLAGLFYGRAYARTGSLTAPCLVHALVDTIWREGFR